MDINMQTRFNIGDPVWIPDIYYEWFPRKEVYYIEKINISVDLNQTRVSYVVQDIRGNRHEYSSRVCFASYEECKEWCERR